MIYLDNNSTTPVDPKVLDAMLPYFREHFGNASSRSHAPGWIAEEAVKIAREQIASLLQVQPREIIFTSGATESINLAIKGVFETYASKGKHIITAYTEHKAVLDTCEALITKGAEVTYLPTDREGMINLDDLQKAIRPDTILVTFMWANNETGVIHPIEQIGKICEEKDVIFLTDGTQVFGKIPTLPEARGVHLMAFSGHKIFGPKGVGALYVRMKNPRIKLRAQIDGGGHERAMRSGTLNVPGIVGLGKAAEVASASMEATADRLRQLRDLLEERLLQNIEDSHINGAIHQRLSHVSNIRFKHIDGESLMMTFNQKMAISSGSACTSASVEPSHVLTAMGLSPDEAHSSIRISLGRFTTEEEVDKAYQLISQGVKTLRIQSPVWRMYKEEKTV